MRMLAIAFLTVMALLAGCPKDSDIDPAVASAIRSLQDNPDIPDSWVEFTRTATGAGLIKTPDDVQRVGESFSHACLDYAITDELGMKRTSDDEIRRVLREHDGVHVTAEQFEWVKPALEKMCADMKNDRPRASDAFSPQYVSLLPNW
jgi:hypothetical protein